MDKDFIALRRMYFGMLCADNNTNGRVNHIEAMWENAHKMALYALTQEGIEAIGKREEANKLPLR